jgi:hypothetical protein
LWSDRSSTFVVTEVAAVAASFGFFGFVGFVVVLKGG